MKEQPTALRLAAELEACPTINYKAHAAELRRLAAVEAQRDALLEALKLAVRQNEHDMVMTGEECRQCRAAIKAVEGEKG